VQQLEDRTVPTTFTWQGNNGDLWTDGTKWDQGTAPTTGSDVVINNSTTPNYNTTVEINTLALSAASGLNISGGTLTIDAASTLNGSVALSAGSLAANGTASLAGTTTWTGGELSATGAASWTNTGTILLNGANTEFLTGTLNNSGTITQSNSNTLLIDASSTLNNSGLFDILQSGTGFQTNGLSGWAINNSGTFQKSAGSGTSVFGGVPFNNASGGIVNVTAGTLSLNGGGTDTGGTFTVSGGATLDLTGGSSPTLTGTYTGSGAGIVSLASGTLVIGAAGATFNFPAGLFQWTGGTINASAGTLTNKASTGFITLNGTGTEFLSGTLANAGTITQTTPGSGNNILAFNSGAVLNNSGLYDVQQNSTALQTNGGSGWSFNNLAAGTFQKSAGTGTTNNGALPFNNVGTVIVKTGTLSLANVAQDNSGTNTLTGGTWNVLANATLTFSSGDNFLNNNGAITLDGANSTFTNISLLAANNGSFTIKDGQSYATSGDFSNAGSLTVDATGGSETFSVNGNFMQTAGSTTLVKGAVLESAVTSVAFAGGVLQGTGTVTGNVTNSGGTISPGVNTGTKAAGVLTVSGKYNQSAGGTVAFKVGGITGPGTNYDQLVVLQTANLAGSISASIFNNYTPAANDNIPNVLHFAAKTGDFSPQLKLSLGNGLYLVEQYSPAVNPVQLNFLVVTAPVANDQSVVVAENTAKNITLTSSDPNNDPLTFTVTASPAHGTLSGTAPNLTFTPANNFLGADSFQFTVTDQTTGLVSNTGTVSITVVAPPTANPQTVVGGENTAKGITLTGSAPNGDAFTFQVASQPAHGTLSGTAPNLTFTPANNFTGTDSFTFTVTDTASGLVSSPATVSITVVPPPTADAQSLVVGENTAKGITLTGSAPNGDAFTFQVASQPAHGTLSGTAPNLTFTPANNFTGADSFTFTVTDTASGLVSSAATVSITVVPPPTANAQSVTVEENTATGITLTGSAPNGDAFTFQVASQPAHGTLSGTAPNLTYSPANNFTGGDSFTFTVTDTVSGLVSSAASITIAVVAPPTANSQSVVVGQNTAKGITLTGSAPNGDAFTFQVASQPAHGTLSGTAPNLTFTPANNFTGTDSFTFTVTDSVTGFVSTAATVSITVVPPPTANAQSVVVGENTAKGITLTGSAPNGDAFTFQVASQPANGTLSGTAPNLTYTPANNFTGSDTFTFTVTDTASGLVSASATVSITVVPPPTANTQSVTVLQNTATGITLTGSAPNGDAFTFQVASQPAHGALSGTAPNLTYTPANNYTGPDSFTFTVTDTVSGLVSSAATVSITVQSQQLPTANPQSAVVGQDTAKNLTLTGSAPNGDAFTFAIGTQPSHGALSNFNSATGQVTYTPANNYTGPDSFTFTVTDTVTQLTSAAATVSLTVVPPPTADPQAVTVQQNTATGVTLTGSAPNGDAFTFQLASQPAHGTLSGTAPNLTYTPANNYTGPDSFTFTVTDTTSGLVSPAATVAINVVAPPTANAQAVVVGENTAKGITLTGSAPSGDAFTFQVASQPAHGTLSGTAPNLTYTPANNFTGTDSFTFTVTDTVTGFVSSAATVSITVVPPPTANGQSVTVPLNTATGVTLTGSAPNGDAFTFQVASQPAHGTLSGTAPNLTYTPANNYTGPDSFTFTVTDTASGLVSAAATVSITVIQSAGPFTYRWNGSVSPDWFTAANWTDVNNGNHHAVPTAADSVFLTGGPFDAVLSADATIANLQMNTGFLTINANLTDTGNYYQDMGFVAFGSNANQLIIDGNVTRPGGIFFGSVGTVVWGGSSSQTIQDTSNHPLPNLSITNNSPAGVTFANGHLVIGNTLVLQSGSALTVSPGATMMANGDFTDNGMLNLTVPAPGNGTAPLTVGGTLNVSSTSAFNLTVGSPFGGAVYTFLSYAAVSGAGSVNPANIHVLGNALFNAFPNFGAAAFTVTLVSPGFIDNWTGGADSNWFNPLNWTDAANSAYHFVPGAMDTAVIRGAPNDPTLTGDATVGKLVIGTGTLTLAANLNDLGDYYQDQGFVKFQNDSDQLTIDGDVSHLGGFLSTNGHGTVVLAGTVAQNVIDHSGHALPNVLVSNTSTAGVTLAAGSTLGATSLTLAAGSALNLSVPAPGNQAAPLIVSGAVTLGSGSQLNLTMGGPLSGASYLFIQFGSLVDDGVVFAFFGQGGFTPTANENANSLTVTLA
jgi:hypothetical protein